MTDWRVAAIVLLGVPMALVLTRVLATLALKLSVLGKS